MDLKFGKLNVPWQNYFYTVYLILNTTSYGLLFALFPNILVDMKYILDTTMELISFYPTVETVGYILGTLAGLCYKFLNRQLMICVTYTLLTISCAVIPLLPNLWLLYVCAFVFGFGSSVQVCGYTVWTMEMWRHRSGPILQIHDFGFGIGSILCTVILKPYLVGEINTDSGDEHKIMSNTSDYIQHTNELQITSEYRRERLMWPTILIGICILPISISSFFMYFIKPYKTEEIQSKQNTEDLTEKKKLFDRPETPRKTVRLLFAIWFTFYVIFETVFLKFAVTYFQYCPLKLSAQTGAQIFWISTSVYTGFRGINVFIALKVKMVYMLSYHYLILLIGIILLFIGQNQLTVIWTASIVMCLGFSAMFAVIFAFTGQYLTLTDRLSTVFILIRGLFNLFTPIVIGIYIEDNSIVFIIVQLVYLIVSLISFITILYLIRKYSALLNTNQTDK